MRILLVIVVFVFAFLLSGLLYREVLLAQTSTKFISPTPASMSTPTPVPQVRDDLTEETEPVVDRLEAILDEQELGPVWPTNPAKYAIRASVTSGVPTNTITLLLLLPLVASVIAAARHIIGLRGFGIFLPAALSVVFLAIGPIVGIGLFLLIVSISILYRLLTKKAKIKLQFLPNKAMLLLFVVVGVLLLLFAAPVIQHPDLINVSIFPVLILVLLAEDFSRVQLGKSAKTAINLTTETLVLALVSYVFLTYKPLQEFALLYPEILLLAVILFNFAVGKYVGLRFIEFWRFRKLISD
ncbi:7TM domain-containing protein [Patescibacteria group bacterium]